MEFNEIEAIKTAKLGMAARQFVEQDIVQTAIEEFQLGLALSLKNIPIGDDVALKDIHGTIVAFDGLVNLFQMYIDRGLVAEQELTAFEEENKKIIQ